MPKFKATVAMAMDVVVHGESSNEAASHALAIVLANPFLRKSEVSSIQVIPVVAEIAGPLLHDANVSYWQESLAIELGTTRQRALWERAQLPEGELSEIARSVLFAPFKGCRRRVRMGSSAVHRSSKPSDAECSGIIHWSSKPCQLAELAAWEVVPLHRVLKLAEEASNHPWLRATPHNFEVEVRQHVGTCEVCNRTAADTSALVSVRWASRTLSREYAL